jgi:hypothetical protein
MAPRSPFGIEALRLASHGWQVFPLHNPVKVGPKAGSGRARCSCRRISCQAQGKHPRTAAAWWQAWPRANIGLLTGQAFDVLDLDDPDAYEALRAVGNVDALTGPRVMTGRGLHFYVQATGLGNKAGLIPGADWRGQGGYVVAPPSLHYAGRPYRWSEGYGPEVTPGPCPVWLADLLRPPVAPVRPVGLPAGLGPSNGPRYGRAALQAECLELMKAPVGTRNQALNRAAFKIGQLVADGLDEATAVAALTAAGLGTGLGQWEVDQTVRRGLTDGVSRPRTRRGRA